MFVHPYIRKRHESAADTHRAKALAESPKPRETRNLDLSPSPSSSTGLTEELQCSFCLDVFTNPVTTPCGHNFCQICLKECWDNSKDYNCPICKKTFNQKPELKVNTTLRAIVDLYKKRNRLKIPEVLCDICTKTKLKALKSCPVCQSSYCETHLKRHLRIPGLKQHKLIDPVKNLQDHLCQKHDRPLELFCRDDQTCVCVICTVTEHKTHNNVPVEEESVKKKTLLMKSQTDGLQMIQDRIKKTKDIQHSIKLRKKNTEKEKADCVELFTDLIRSIESCQSELLEVMEQKQKAEEKQAEELIKELEQEIMELKRRNTELEQLSHTEDHLHLLQIYPSLCSPLDTKIWTGISINTCGSVETLRSALAQLQDTLVKKLSQTVMKRIQRYAVDVTLDPNKAHPELTLSEDGKQVRLGNIKHDYPHNYKRFDKCIVLGKEGFSSGRFYFEVQVQGITQWCLGVARQSINRKRDLYPCPENGNWSLWQSNGKMYKAGESSPVSLSLKVKPQKVGVFVDYEEGLVSFYDVESRSHIYSFTDQSFTEKLYPYLSPWTNDKGKHSASLIISPVSYNE
ncbi:LOW QUALITY PROTEIN: bloodthirsty-related gene family, member 9 [Rhinichthys klamathensis goyatoka]|uniref:LOW QUALITY PROTEIN: bloodthirsty-related gene family, member 9 n=1 Tax=Rhinichthys klamathensis goyatoka TaxID=3034132 RepID=UPI0024B4C781|nr:LOW QUALITY PROTEIN: bloodthirsty-related gene family, member 9 [Rhinichthys klamathensis goyatoka]